MLKLKKPNQKPQGSKPGLHPRNRHQGRYDFAALQGVSPELAAFVIHNPAGEPTVNFADPQAVKALNRALLALQYGIAHWDIPDGFLCPPIPGRADYIHTLADLLAADSHGVVPCGGAVRVLDIGVGANCIYPLIGHAEYGWRFVGSDIDAQAIRCAETIIAANPGLSGAISCRLQRDSEAIFEGVIRPGEHYALSLCNPPFHASAAEASAGSRRKVANLSGKQGGKPVLNFGGRSHELWCEGGEAAFIARMVDESQRFATQCLWFSTLVSRSDNLADIRYALKQAGALEVKTLAMGQGQKQSRVVAWSFMDSAARQQSLGKTG
ncbi:23S rRNA (adenine(1618)-N(6))-methyltransferase RlmF [Craterilacuibacter sp. RT1T]|uniref:23S rRNA (adenine(1618)-N(6))-methyltransferase RlmF n=1 Tax=Craterilacuibacter sp. RT1T TaxID=2942211 RepID=UPI0020BEAEB4|nr:23S rRNA (adenine(1618)-N(6))-methyltransferase RlmF [Craterilacuibacter sp. RT1T]MCL6264756.1 23S rRNA (adenine(1618)-N(6))-methyltransferase RlmF [Craterilacuibacter sp. RT1T]